MRCIELRGCLVLKRLIGDDSPAQKKTVAVDETKSRGWGSEEARGEAQRGLK